MKTRFLLLPLLILAAAFPSRAALIYSGVQNVPIPIEPPPVGLEGVYLQLPSGTTTGAFPPDWNTAPWINPFFGGVDIANSPLLRPVITGTDQIQNLAFGTPINVTSNFVSGESGSSTHVGPAANQFQLGTPGLIGLTFKTTASGPDQYGWIRMTASNTGPGAIVDWAYESTPGVGVFAGVIPEPGTALYGLALCAVSAWRRRRVA
jgi:hypothetical protein